jgi:Mg2+ and Co2+ transporter CorA
MATMDNIEKIEQEISNIRYKLMLKGTALDFAKQNVSKDNIEKIDALTKEVLKLRNSFSKLNEEIRKLKFPYYVSYEVHFINIWTQQKEKETYNEVFLLNKDLQIDLPSKNDWKLDDTEISRFLLDLLSLLKHKYDEVTLLRVKRMK